MSKFNSIIEEVQLTQKEVTAPNHKWCSSGHKAPDIFRRAGPDSPELPMRFFEISSNDIKGIYCEACLIIANHMASLKKQNKL